MPKRRYLDGFLGLAGGVTIVSTSVLARSMLKRFSMETSRDASLPPIGMMDELE